VYTNDALDVLMIIEKSCILGFLFISRGPSFSNHGRYNEEITSQSSRLTHFPKDFLAASQKRKHLLTCISQPISIALRLRKIICRSFMALQCFMSSTREQWIKLVRTYHP
jgi:hypothetical protein